MDDLEIYDVNVYNSRNRQKRPMSNVLVPIIYKSEHGFIIITKQNCMMVKKCRIDEYVLPGTVVVDLSITFQKNLGAFNTIIGKN